MSSMWRFSLVSPHFFFFLFFFWSHFSPPIFLSSKKKGPHTIISMDTFQDGKMKKDDLKM